MYQLIAESGPFVVPLIALFAVGIVSMPVRWALRRRTGFDGFDASLLQLLVAMGGLGTSLGYFQMTQAVSHASREVSLSLLTAGSAIAPLVLGEALLLALVLAPMLALLQARMGRASTGRLSLPIALTGMVMLAAGAWTVLDLHDVLQFFAFRSAETTGAYALNEAFVGSSMTWLVASGVSALTLGVSMLLGLRDLRSDPVA